MTASLFTFTDKPRENGAASPGTLVAELPAKRFFFFFNGTAWDAFSLPVLHALLLALLALGVADTENAAAVISPLCLDTSLLTSTLNASVSETGWQTREAKG